MKARMVLLAAGTAVFMAGTNVAVAQRHEEPRGAPAEKMAPKEPASGQTGATNNQKRQIDGAMPIGGAENNRRNAADHSGGNSPRTGESQNRDRSETTGQAPQNERREQRNESNRANDEKSRNQNRATEERGNGRNNDRDRTTTGQGAAPTKGPNSSLSVNITPENRTRIHDVFINERSAPRVNNVDFALSVGTPVPRSVHIVAVPSEIVEIEPQWRGFEYFMVGDQVVIVNPRTMEIVAVLDV